MGSLKSIQHAVSHLLQHRADERQNVSTWTDLERQVDTRREVSVLAQTGSWGCGLTSKPWLTFSGAD